ncbi:M48 family metallopeptidase [Maridesulfovibrio salexigens]|uniref:Ste24 endopeptidase n=1 Tax=Maridesulfovibrio salexigens (strain ATCC 14822 / DSM 2638 / NCIMB 8403 / VKM B-1763) TaxID=526222 RepID=C6C0Y5_MARSD|nr:M48 family metallopeptidase [Maridesulfovibrio salexigens]ACS81082.1 Ste24 endopeptidase [Maridesulfovibrio salexigens DSM 2638]
MNIYLFIIIFSLAGACLLGIFSRQLNRKALSPELPAEFSATFDADDYRKSQDYTKAGIGFENISSSVSTLITILFIVLGGFNAVDLWANGFGYGEILTGLIFYAGLAVLSDIVSLPFSLYSTFVIEEKFGFNKTTLKTYFMDKLKGYLLGGIIGGAILGGVLLFFNAAGSLAWLWCWIFTVLITLGVQYIAPTWILPLFNKFTPLEDGELKEKIELFAADNGFELSGIFMIDGSKRSTKANAFFTGFGKKKRIALFDTLINNLSTDEIVAVLAHEIGHSKLGHIRKMMTMSIINTGVIFLLMSFFLGNKELFAAFGMQNISVHAGLIFFALLYTPVSIVLSIFSNIRSRKHEFEADAFAAETTRTPEALVEALKKLSVSNLANLTPHPFYVWLEYSHPPVLKRIEALRAFNIN